MTDKRTEEIASRLSTVRRAIEKAATSAGRIPDGICLVAVTKTFPVDDARRLVALGVTELGESRDREARAKAAEVADARWHFIGRLQRNKAASVARYAEVVHSVDRMPLVAALDAAAARAGRVIEVFCQVSLDGDPGRGGVDREALPELSDAVAAAGSLRLSGLMAVPPPGADADAAYADIARIADRIRARHPEASGLSAGMTADFPTAIRYGATHVRIGSALLGRRPAHLG